MTKPAYVNIRLTRKQTLAADSALMILINRVAALEERHDYQPSQIIWEQEALFRLRAALVSAASLEQAQVDASVGSR